MAFNPFDKNTSREETAVLLGIYIIGSLATVWFLDLATVAVGIKPHTNLPEQVGTFVLTSGSTLLGYLVGKKAAIRDPKGNKIESGPPGPAPTS